MADIYLKSGAGAVERTNSAVVALAGKMVIAIADVTANYLVARAWVWECTTAGDTGAAVPAWPATVTQDTTTVTDGTVVWTARRPGFSSGTTANWTFATIFLHYATQAAAAGDTVFVSQAHNELVAPVTTTFAGTELLPIKVLCGNDAAAPPTALASTGVVAWTVASGTIGLTGSSYVYGMTFRYSAGALNTILILASAGNQLQQYESCTFEILSTGVLARLATGTSSSVDPVGVDFKDCWVKYGKNTTSIEVVSTRFSWQGGGLLAGNAMDTALMKVISVGEGFLIELSGLDLTNMAATTNIFAISGSTGQAIIRDCTLPVGWTGLLTSSVSQAARCSMYNCEASGVDTNYRMWIVDYTGSIRSETTIVRTGGASDGTTPLAWKMVTAANAVEFVSPLNSDEIIIWNDVVGTAVTATIEFVHDSVGGGAGAAMLDDEIWMDVLYAGTLDKSQGLFVSDHKATFLTAAADQTASTEAWTATGLTTPVKQKLSVTFTPQEKGYIKARVYLGKASKTVYICPKMTVA